MKRFGARLFRLSAWRFAVVAAVVIAAVGGAAFGAYTAWNEAEAEVQEVRWVNLTVTISADSDIHYARLSSAPEAVARGIMGPVLLLTTGGDGSTVVIDAETGQVIHDDVLAAERAAFDAVLAAVEVVETEVREGPGAPWPYGSTLPSTPRERWHTISYVRPHPDSGISVQIGISDFIGPPPPASGPDIRVFNGRSQMHVSWTGEVFLTGGSTLSLAEFVQAESRLLEGIHPDDRAAFQRFAQAIEIGPPPTPTPLPWQQTP